MSTSLSQLVLDFIVFAIIHYYIIFPLMTKALGFITGEEKPWNPTVFETLKDFINGDKEEQQPSTTATAPFTIDTIIEEAECEKCTILLESQQYITRQGCRCTWCAECVEECFQQVNFDLDAPLTGLSKHCESARNLTIRQMWPHVRHLLSEKTQRYIDTMEGIDLAKNDWMLDVDEVEE
ncbi:hypothetical protein E4T52_02794 [Aureobasidium sp. EXF-3400]|nr:hypothetical protein E4T51_01229 [Aureobasidium sp. EXF-12344]KAI4782279.1 hypothetical protein E4T52_02794 [Aureobasidium sp. EXF-3400]